MKHDEAMRGRLRALAEGEQLPELTSTARARVEVRALTSLKRHEQRRTRLFGLGMACAVMGALTVMGLLVMQARSITHDEVSSAPSLSSGHEPAARVVQSSIGCPEHLGSSWHRAGDGSQELDLGSRALLAASAGAGIAHAFSESCDVRADLAAGSVAVHARDLRGSKLVVHTPNGDVTVKGTIFEVEVEPQSSELRVSVDEGLVEVNTSSGQRLEVHPGRRVRIGSSVIEERLSRSARDALRRRLGLAPLEPSTTAKPGVLESAPVRDAAVPQVETPGSAPEPKLDEARAWHNGSVDMPREPPQPGTSLTEDGRPMEKPRVVEEP